MMPLTRPEASVTALLQWIQPWVCTTLLMARPTPPTRIVLLLQVRPAAARPCSASETRNSTLCRVVKRTMAVAVAVGDVADAADPIGAHQPRRGRAHRGQHARPIR